MARMPLTCSPCGRAQASDCVHLTRGADDIAVYSTGKNDASNCKNNDLFSKGTYEQAFAEFSCAIALGAY